MTRYVGWTAVMTVLWVLPVSAQTTLSESVERALENNPDMHLVQHARQEAHAQIGEARAGYKPRVQLNAATGHERTHTSTTRNRSTRGDGGPAVSLWRQESDVTLTQGLFYGFRTVNDVAASHARERAARLRVNDRALLLGFESTRAFLDVLRRQELVALAEENVTVHREHLAHMEERLVYKAGSRADVQQVQARLAFAQTQVSQRQSELRDAQAVYRRVVGDAPKMLDGDVLPEKALPDAVEDALDAVFQHHPLLHMLVAEVTAAQKAYEQSKSRFLPEVEMDVRASRNRDIDGVRGPYSDQAAMLRMRYNLYNGGADTARKRQMYYRLAQAKDRHEQAKMDVEQELYIAWHGLTSARERLVESEKQEKASREVRDAYKEQFQVGKRTLLDVLDAQNEYFDTRSVKVRARFDVAEYTYRIHAVMGQLLDVLGVRLPEHAIATP